MGDFDKDLSEMNEAWKGAEVKETTEFTPLPDGTYQVQVEEARMERSKKAGRLQIAFVFEVLAPSDKRGRKIFHYRGLDNPDAIGWAKNDLYRMGVQTEELTDLQADLITALDRIIEVSLKTKGEYQNCYVNRLLHGADFADDSDSLPATEDEISF